LPEYPDIKIEIVIDDGRIDVLAERLDAGMRPGETAAKEMIAVRPAGRGPPFLAAGHNLEGRPLPGPRHRLVNDRDEARSSR